MSNIYDSDKDVSMYTVSDIKMMRDKLNKECAGKGFFSEKDFFSNTVISDGFIVELYEGLFRAS